MSDRMIIIKKKTVYGNVLYYPVCKDAEIFCKLTNKKTLDMRDISLIKSLGFIVTLEQESI
jgi:hypothetical protein